MASNAHGYHGYKNDFFVLPRIRRILSHRKIGGYLESFCPHCNQGLTSNRTLWLEAVTQDNDSSMVELNPFNDKASLWNCTRFSEDQELKDLRCPQCGHSLIIEDESCEICHSHLARFLVSLPYSKVPFFICMNVGCDFHIIWLHQNHWITRFRSLLQRGALLHLAERHESIKA